MKKRVIILILGIIIASCVAVHLTIDSDQTREKKIEIKKRINKIDSLKSK